MSAVVLPTYQQWLVRAAPLFPRTESLDSFPELYDSIHKKLSVIIGQIGPFENPFRAQDCAKEIRAMQGNLLVAALAYLKLLCTSSDLKTRGLGLIIQSNLLDSYILGKQFLDR